jgi:hypothetical protein
MVPNFFVTQTTPPLSAITGNVYGSHSHIFLPLLTFSSVSQKSLDPYGTLYMASWRPFSSSMESWVFLPMIILFILESSIMFLFVILIFPEEWAITWDSSLIWAVPPTWKVLIVNWVPGSPIDCAAIIPIASPSATIFPLDKSLPYDMAQTPFVEPHVITE